MSTGIGSEVPNENAALVDANRQLAAGLSVGLRRAGFEAFCAWWSANDTTALGDTGSSAQTTVRTQGFPCDIATITPLLRKLAATNHGGPLSLNLAQDVTRKVSDTDLARLAEPFREANVGSPWLFIVPFADRCGFCLAAAPQDVDDAELDGAVGAVVRHFDRLATSFPVRPPIAEDTYADRFSRREREILLWCSQGKTNWEIGQILGISENTVRFSLKRVFRKLDVTTRSAAVRTALARGVIEDLPSGRKAALVAMYRSFVEGDPGPLRAILADDVVLVATAPEELFAHAGRYEGPDGVLEHAAAVNKEYACHRFFPLIMAEDGDEIAVYLEVELTHRATGRGMCFDCAHFWTFRDDKVIHYVEMFNTAQAHRQLDGLAQAPGLVQGRVPHKS